MKKHTKVSFCQTSLNTLAQSGTEKAKIVSGSGTELNSDKALLGRAKRKMITNQMTMSLIDVVKEKEEFWRLQGYWNTYHCQRVIYMSDGKLFGRYCKNRHCLLCLSIRKAAIINRYLPIISTWPEPHFVTITAKSVDLNHIAKQMKSLLNGFQQITSKHRKRAQRGRGKKLVGIKSLESNFNPQKKTYNPHFHLLVADRQMADIIVKEWLDKCPSHLARPSAQKISKIWDNETALIEVVKYGSKIFTEPDVNSKTAKKGDCDIYAAALDNIFSAMKGHRIFERFGFNLPTLHKEGKTSLITDFIEWTFEPKVFDWINHDIDLPLMGLVPSQELINLLAFNIDTNKE
jgi:hypothetical protein